MWSWCGSSQKLTAPELYFQENETHVDELLLLLIGHFPQAIVASGQVSLQAGQGCHHHPLHLTTLSPRAGWGEAQAADAAASPDAGWQDVSLVKHAVGYLEVNAHRRERKGNFSFIQEGVTDGRRDPAVMGLWGVLTFEASRSVGCVMVLGSYPLCLSLMTGSKSSENTWEDQ